MDSRHGRPRGRSANIFINYRREDTAGHAGRLYDSLNSHFAGRLFMDVDTLKPGVDFVDAIDQAVGSCEVLIVIIGRDWLTVKDAAGRRRLDNPADFVRVEVERALARQIRVIPVLVEDAPMPPAEELPPSLARLARRNAIELSDARWSYDVERLAQTIQEILEDTGVSAPAPSAAHPPTVPPPVVAVPPVPAAKAGKSRAFKLSLAALVLAPVAVVALAFVVVLVAAVVQTFGGNQGPADARSAAAIDGSAAPMGSDATEGPANGEPGHLAGPATAKTENAPAGDGSAGNDLPAANRGDAAPSASPAVDSRAANAAYDDTLQSPQATIVSPQGGDKIGPSMLVQGAISGLGGGQRAFLCVKTQGVLYARGELVPNAEGRWSLQAKSAKQDFETFVVVSTSPEAAALLSDSSTREQGLSSLPPGAAITSPVVALKRQGKWADIFRPRGKRQPDSASNLHQEP